MNYLPSVFFLVLAIVQGGVLLISWSFTHKERDVQGQLFYNLSLIFGTVAMLGFAITVLPANQSGPLVWTHTLSNVAYLLTFLNMLLFCVAQLRSIRREELLGIGLFLLVWALWFEYLRRTGTFYERTLLVFIPLCTINAGQLVALSRLIRQTPSRQLRALQVVIAINLGLVLLRLMVFQLHLLPLDFPVDQIPALLVLALCLQFSLHLLELNAISGFWFEQITLRRQKTVIENQRITELIDEKDTLIHSLHRIRKVAETGALSASLAHEINQPLTAVQLDAQMLQILLQDHAAAEQTHPFLQRIISNNARAAQTIQTLRQLFSAGKQALLPASVDTVIEQALTLTIPRLERGQVELLKNLSAPVPTALIEDHLHMVMINLLNNACEALHGHPHPQLAIRSWQTQSHTLIEISDNGSGISDADQSQIFDLLKTTKTEGTGIGLWLSRFLMERQGGQITLEPGSGEGATFVITLPMS